MKSDLLRARFVSVFQGQESAIYKGDSKAVRNLNPRVSSLMKILLSMGDTRVEVLSPLLNHPSSNVSVTAAALLLRDRPLDAVPVLEKIAGTSGFTAIGARLTLQRWREEGKVL